MNKDGKGVYEEENTKPTFLYFFKLLFRKFSKIIRLNLMLLVQFIPVFVFLYAFVAGTKTPTALESVYAPLYGISQIIPSASMTSFLDVQSIQMGVPVIHPVLMVVLTVLAVITAVTFGWFNTGAAYVLRGLVRGDAVFIWSDFFYAIKRNLKQSFFMGLIDFICIVVLVVDFMHLYNITGSYFNDVMYIMVCAIAIIFITMRFYMYQLLITFDLKTLKILKNSLIFTVLGIKRNIMALLGFVVVIALNVVIIFFSLSVGFSIPIILPAFYVVALLGFISTYAAYPIIDKYMIAPYASENDTPAEEPIFHDEEE
ncbi:MAG: DUF624 domain-containing protein [Ruminococcaceae bacterium]|nr:DUF624 domain-containing protein [Oscillospiraceae bacterium]